MRKSYDKSCPHFISNTFMIKTLKKPLRKIKKQLFKIELLQYLFSLNSNKNNRLIIVTGADSSHYKSLRQFLSSVLTHEPQTYVVVFDLGLTEIEQQSIKNDFPKIDFRVFDYSKYPEYFNIKINAGEYAWKPIIIHQILNEFKCCVCWMDAGNIIQEPLLWIRAITAKIGVYSSHSAGRISDWTHPKTLDFLNASKNLLRKKNLNGACVALCYQNSTAKKVADKWKECALTKICIAPEGSNRSNHRQDQAALSVIIHQLDIAKNIPTKCYGFAIHRDID